MAKIAFLVGPMFEDSEFRIPYDRVKAAGYEAVVIGLQAGQSIPGKKGKETATIDLAIDAASAGDFAGLVIPGGYSPDQLRTHAKVVAFTREMVQSGKPVAAVCHAPSLLIEADAVDGKQVTSWPSIRTDLINAGARWVDKEVVEDGNLITSRKPDDLEAFSAALIGQLRAGAAFVKPAAPGATVGARQ